MDEGLCRPQAIKISQMNNYDLNLENRMSDLMRRMKIQFKVTLKLKGFRVV